VTYPKVIFDYQILAEQSYGGISKYITELAYEMFALGVDAKVFSGLHVNRYLDTRIPPDRQVLRVGVINPFRGSRRVLMAVNGLLWRNYINSASTSPLVVHHSYYEMIKSPNSALKIYTVYDCIHERYPNYFAKGDYEVNRKRKALVSADKIIAISNSTLSDLEYYYPEVAHKTSVVPLGVHIYGDMLWSQKNQKEYLVFVGRRDGYKNFDIVIKLFKSQPELSRRFDIVCFGGEALGDISWMKYGRITMCSGSDESLATLLAGAAALIYPSFYEGFGLPILEAYSVGCPVITSNTSSMPEVGGDLAIYIDPSDSESLMHALTLISSQSTADQAMDRRNRARNFSWTNCAKKTLDCYER
jgi:glycosyltransferase involved in cell wall biosynthesis